MADVLTDLKNWDSIAGNNLPTGTTTVGTGLDDNLRQIQAVVRQDLASVGSNVASAATTDIGAVAGLFLTVTGVVTITALGSVSAGVWKVLTFAGALTLTHNGTSLICPGAVNLVTTVNDCVMAQSLGAGNWKIYPYYTALSSANATTATTALNLSGTPAFFAPITASLGANVALSNTALYFDGPSVAQGTTGKWYASGNITAGGSLNDAIYCKLWDGTTLIDSSIGQVGANGYVSLSVSGSLPNAPSGNLRISVRNATSTSACNILYNTTGLGKDCTITAFRCG